MDGAGLDRNGSLEGRLDAGERELRGDAGRRENLCLVRGCS
jgi:hypothetical protein